MSITKNCPILEQLHGNIIITDAGLIEFGKRCPQLITFNLTRFTDVGVMALAEGCRGLKDISIENDSTHDGISDASILKLTESCEYLEYLGLNAA